MYLRYVVCTCTLDQFLSLPPLLIAYTYMQSCMHTVDGLHTRCFNLFFSWEAACFSQDQNTRRPCGYLPKSTMVMFGLPYNPYYSACFFNRNSAFLSQQFSHNSVFSQFSQVSASRTRPMFDRSSHVLNAAATNLTYGSNAMRAASAYISSIKHI